MIRENVLIKVKCLFKSESTNHLIQCFLTSVSRPQREYQIERVKLPRLRHIGLPDIIIVLIRL